MHLRGEAPAAGKNYSKNGSAQRSPRDLYQTPYSMTRALLGLPEMARTRLPILEPASGHCAIVRVLRDSGLGDGLLHYDLSGGVDFMAETRRFPTIITNPPFRQSLEFIKKCKEVATDTFALLLDLEYLHGAERYREVFSVVDHWPLVSVNVFIRRPMLAEGLRLDGLYETGMTTYAWYIWKRSWRARRSEPVIRWIDNDGCVVRKGRS